MRYYFNQPAKFFCMVMALLFSFGLKAQEADNEFNLNFTEKKAAHHGLLSSGFPVGPQGRRPRGA